MIMNIHQPSKPIEINHLEETIFTKFQNAACMICLGVLVALLMNGELGQWINYLSDHNFALNVGALIKEPCTYIP